MLDSAKRKCSYYYHEEIGNYHYGNLHPMKPHRVKMADSMIKSYGMYDMMDDMTLPDEYLEELDMTKFHADDYIDFLREITPENVAKYSDQLLRFNIGEDCPIFDGLYDF
jgi:histone deacetylase 1/2